MTELRIRSTEPRAGALVDDIVFDGPDGLEVEAFLVRPTVAPPDASLAGILMWHWLDSEAPDGNRTQYLDEAADLAAAGAVCLLPQGRFPWSQPPTGSAADTAEILAEVARLRAGLDLLVARQEVDPGRLAVVGHDFGGMIAAVAAADEDRLKALVIVAATPALGRLVPAVLGHRRGPHRLPARDAPDRSRSRSSAAPGRRRSCSSSVEATSSSPR